MTDRYHRKQQREETGAPLTQAGSHTPVSYTPKEERFCFFLNTNNLAISGYLSGLECFLGNHIQ